MLNTLRRFHRLGLFTLIGAFALLSDGCSGLLKAGEAAKTIPPVQTVTLKAGVNTVKLIDQQAQREIDIAWNNAALEKLAENRATPEIVRLSANNATEDAAQVPITLVVTQREPAIPKTAARPETVRLHRVLVKDANGKMVNLGSDGQYHLTPGEKVRLDVELDNPAKQPATVEALPRTGRMEGNTTYIAPAMPGDTDQVNIKVFSARTGTLLDMDRITINNDRAETTTENLSPTEHKASAFFVKCPPENKSLEEVQQTLPEHLRQYTTLKAEETQGLQRNKDIIGALEKIICDLAAIESILDKNYPIRSADISEKIQKTRSTRKEYEQERLDRLNHL